MTEDEFKKKMLELGWNIRDVEEIIEERNKCIANNEPYLPYEGYLIQLPISD